MVVEPQKGISLSHGSLGLSAVCIGQLLITRCKQFNITASHHKQHIYNNATRKAQLHALSLHALLYLILHLTFVLDSGRTASHGRRNGQRRQQPVDASGTSYRWPIATQADVLERQCCINRHLNLRPRCASVLILRRSFAANISG